MSIPIKKDTTTIPQNIKTLSTTVIQSLKSNLPPKKTAETDTITKKRDQLALVTPLLNVQLPILTLEKKENKVNLICNALQHTFQQLNPEKYQLFILSFFH
jgi:hypothetical protein